MIVLDLLVGLLVAVAVLVGLVLVMPLSVSAWGVASDDEGLDGRVRAAWAFGFLALHLGPDGVVLRLLGMPIARPGRKSPDAKKGKEEKSEKDESRGKRGLGWAFARRHLLLALLRKFVRALHLRGGVSGVVGLPQPDQTAVLHETLLTLEAALPAGLVAVDVDWVEEVVDLRADIRSWVVPLQILAIGAWIFLNPRTRRALRATG